MKRSLMLTPALIAAVALPAFAQTSYKLPPPEVVAMIDAAPAPEAELSPVGDAVLVVEAEAYPPITLLSEPVLRIGGIRVTPAINGRQRVRRFTGLSVQALARGSARRVALPDGSRIGWPEWSYDGKRFAFERDLDDGIELWVGDTATATARAVGQVRLNDVLGEPFLWLSDGRRLLVRLVPGGRGKAPAAPRVPSGPVIEEVAGKLSQMPTFQDLIETPHDEDLFEYHGTSQLALVDTVSGQVTPLGEPGLVTNVETSPDGAHLLVSRVRRPFSRRVPYFYFPRTVEVWDLTGARVATIAELPVSDEVPRQGVPMGPRAVSWQPMTGSTVVWVEALDGGDPRRKAEHRDRVMSLAAPFREPRELHKLAHRFSGVDWTAKPGIALVSEFDRDRRWTTTWLVDLATPDRARKVFDLSAQDAYKDPGDPVLETRATGERVAVQDGDTIYLSGRGATESGDRPFLDAFDLRTLATKRLFRSGETSLERFVGFEKRLRRSILTRYESSTEPPNYFLVDLATNRRRQVTTYRDPVPGFAGVKKELVKYTRADGVPLSATLYLPPDYTPGTRLPALVWAYPLEYSDAGTAGQVRGSAYAYPRLVGPSPIVFATRGYVVLMDATMPVVGDPETVNDTYVEQISADARAAVEFLDRRGVADPRRIVVAGHSYGAFMTVNLLAHTDLFAAGLARSGAYNRTLTPFGFQTERRSFWEARDLYMKVSPFTYANQINEPLLLIHGEADNNSGTFPVQSQRLFDAIRAHGGTARLVMLPHEAHGYRARESVLHTLAEMLEWADRYAKNRP
jgi:dipeptidyl aminopeptidase/acylaminoacyl peptidase